jgi:hypothetical protein
VGTQTHLEMMQLMQILLIVAPSDAVTRRVRAERRPMGVSGTSAWSDDLQGFLFGGVGCAILDSITYFL